MSTPNSLPAGFVERMAELDRRRRAARDALNEINRDIAEMLREWWRHAADESTRIPKEERR